MISNLWHKWESIFGFGSHPEDNVIGALFLLMAFAAMFGIYHLIKYWLGLIVFQKYRVDHYQEKNAYYPMVKTLIGWRYITWNGQTHYLRSFKETVSQPALKNGESMIRCFHEQRTKTTVVSLDVKINHPLLKKRQERARKFAEKQKP